MVAREVCVFACVAFLLGVCNMCVCLFVVRVSGLRFGCCFLISHVVGSSWLLPLFLVLALSFPRFHVL